MIPVISFNAVSSHISWQLRFFLHYVSMLPLQPQNHTSPPWFGPAVAAALAPILRDT